MTKEPLQVRILTASERHTMEVMDLTKLIWEGDDYIPEVWSEWMADPEGRLVVAEYQDRIVGLGKLTRMSPVDWWLEGLRVHPDWEGHRVGSQIFDALLETCAEIGYGTVRLMTASFRPIVHHMCNQRGFQAAGHYSMFTAPTRLSDQENQQQEDDLVSPDSPTLPFRPLLLDETREAAIFARSAGSTVLTGEMMYLDWRFAPPRADFFVPFIQEHRAWWWRARQGLVTSYLDAGDDQTPKYPHLSLVACAADNLPPLLLDLRRLYGGMGFDRVEWLARLEPGLVDILASAGFTRISENYGLVFERNLPQSG